MRRDQVIWLVVGIVGALGVLLVVGAAMFVAVNRLGTIADAGQSSDDSVAGIPSNDDPEVEMVDGPKAWQEWAAKANARNEAQKPEYERVKALYERVSPHREIRRRLFHEADFEYAETELPALFAKISDPLAADQYSRAIGQLGKLSVDTDPEDLRKTMKSWTDTHPESHYAWLVRGVLAIDYAWYWRGSGWASSVTDEGWTQFHAAISEARECLEKSHQLEPDDPESSARLIKVCMAQGSSKKEMQLHLDRVTKVVPSHWNAYNDAFEFLKPKWSGSWPEYENLLATLESKTQDKSNPFFLAIYTNALNDMEYEKHDGRDEEAEAQVDRQWVDIWKACLDRWPEDPRLHGLYLVMLTKVKRSQEAWEQYQWLGNRYPMDIEWDLLKFHHNRMYGQIMHANRLPADERSKEFDRIIALDPEFGATFHYIGMCQSQRGQYVEAESALLKALELNPSGESTHYVLASMYERMGRYDDALRVVQDGKDSGPNESVAKGLAQIEQRLQSRDRAPEQAQTP